MQEKLMAQNRTERGGVGGSDNEWKEPWDGNQRLEFEF